MKYYLDFFSVTSAQASSLARAERRAELEFFETSYSSSQLGSARHNFIYSKILNCMEKFYVIIKFLKKYNFLKIIKILIKKNYYFFYIFSKLIFEFNNTNKYFIYNIINIYFIYLLKIFSSWLEP